MKNGSNVKISVEIVRKEPERGLKALGKEIKQDLQAVYQNLPEFLTAVSVPTIPLFKAPSFLNAGKNIINTGIQFAKSYIPIGVITTTAGGLIRQFTGDKEAWAPRKVLTDAVLAGISIPVFGGVSKLMPVATSNLKNVLYRGIEGATTAGIVDLAEDYLRPAIYQAMGKPYEKGGKKVVYPSIKFDNGLPKFEIPVNATAPKIDLKELAFSIPIGFGLGALGGYLENQWEAGKLKVPKFGSAKTPSGQEWHGIYLEDKNKAKPLIGIAKEKGRTFVSVGKPKFKTKIDFSKLGERSHNAELSYVPKTKIERATFEDLIRNSLPRQEAPKIDILKVVDTTYNVQGVPKLMKEDFVKAMKQSDRLKDVADDIINYLQKQPAVFGQVKAKVYGSTTQKGIMGQAMSRRPADLDLAVKNPEKVAKDLVKLLSKKGIKVRVNPANPTLVERQINGQWHHLIDIHPYPESGMPFSYSSENQIGWGFEPKRSELMKISKGKSIEYMPLQEQGVRKATSTLKIWKGGKVAPTLHRNKDIIDAYEVNKFLLKYVKNPTERQQLERILNNWIGLWDKEIGKATINALKQGKLKSVNDLIGIYISKGGVSKGIPNPLIALTQSISEQQKLVENYAPSQPSGTSGGISYVGIGSSSPSQPSKELDKESSKPPSKPSDNEPSTPPSQPSGGSGSISLIPTYPSPSLPPSNYQSPSVSISFEPISYDINRPVLERPMPKPSMPPIPTRVPIPAINYQSQPPEKVNYNTEWQDEFSVF